MELLISAVPRRLGLASSGKIKENGEEGSACLKVTARFVVMLCVFLKGTGLRGHASYR